MNSLMVKSFLIIAIALTAVGGGVYAYFSDTATSTGNVFTAGTLDLKLTDINETAADTVSATWTGSSMQPGDSVTGTLSLKNTGTIAGHHLHLAVANTLTEGAGPGAATTNLMDKMLEITTLSYGGTNILGNVNNSNGNSFVDLDDLEQMSNFGHSITAMSLTDLNTNHDLVMTVRLHPDAGNDNQGDSVATVLTATLNQVASQ